MPAAWPNPSITHCRDPDASPRSSCSRECSGTRLREIFSAFGRVDDVIIREQNPKKKKKGSALVVMAEEGAAARAARSACGDMSNPLLVLRMGAKTGPASSDQRVASGMAAGTSARPVGLSSQSKPLFPAAAAPAKGEEEEEDMLRAAEQARRRPAAFAAGAVAAAAAMPAAKSFPSFGSFSSFPGQPPS